MQDHCWSFLPPKNVTELYDDKKGRRWDLLAKNILEIAEIPDDYPLAAKQAIQRTAIVSGDQNISARTESLRRSTADG